MFSLGGIASSILSIVSQSSSKLELDDMFSSPGLDISREEDKLSELIIYDSPIFILIVWVLFLTSFGSVTLLEDLNKI